MWNLMIVDDSNIIRNKIARIEAEKNFQIVYKARNGLEALTACERFKPDLITMDLTMPEMDGLECIKKIMKIMPNVRILVVSALTDIETGLEALSLGARGFVCKPFTDDELIEALNELMED